MSTNNDAINNQIIKEVIQREGGATATNDPSDAGGRTQYGISERSHPKAWLDSQVTLAEAIDVYHQKYLKGPGFDRITDPRLRSQLVDYGVNSGPGVAIQKLQSVLKVEIDGILGPKTLAVANAADPVLLGNKLALERVKMIGRIVNKNSGQAKFLNGWLDRALSFLHL